MGARGGPSSSVGGGRGGEEAVVMAVARKGPKLGFACYDDLKSTIYIAELLGTWILICLLACLHDPNGNLTV